MRIHDSQAYRKMDVTRERISRILELREILLSIQTGFSFVNAAVACAILQSNSGLEPSSVITEPRYLKLVTVSSLCHYHHQSLICEGRWGTTDDFATSFLHFPLFSTALWDLPNSRHVNSLRLSSYLFLCLPCLLPPFTAPCKMVLARPDEREI